jgi:porphobilinogen deaminase
MRLHGRVISLDGQEAAEGVEEGAAQDEAAAEQLGVALAERLLRSGAAAILGEVRAAEAPVVTEP